MQLLQGLMLKSQCDEASKDLCTTVRRFANLLCLDFASEIERDAGEFKRRVIRLLKGALPPGPGRPCAKLVTRATYMRTKGKSWQEIYAECLSGIISAPESRQLQQSRLRSAVRARLKSHQRYVKTAR